MATYRLQFNSAFTFDQARALIPYLEDLGISACYSSPIFKARPGSQHGYDVVDHQSINPEMGGETAFQRFANALKRHKMGLILDVVPNHMCIADSANPWWNDVLENGPSSPYSSYFDIDWHPPKSELINKILLPELGDQYGREIENQNIKIIYVEGVFFAQYYSNLYPIAPRSWSLLLDLALGSLKGQLPDDNSSMMELQSIRTAVNYLPSRFDTAPEKVKERYREKEIIGKRLAVIVRNDPAIKKAVDASLDSINGRKGDPRSFDQLEIMLEDQVYRLCYWRVATDEINYRRFFDTNHLAAIRVEEPEVFKAVHALVFDLVNQGFVTGLRVDHVDGLFDPENYLERLKEANPETPVVVEKILLGREQLRPDWKTQGTTGYDFLNQTNGLFVQPDNKTKFLDLYARFTGLSRNMDDVLAACKKLIMHVSMASELHVLSSKLDHISEQHRWSRDFTFESLRFALREVIAYFPVYRSYVRPGQSDVTAEDRRYIIAAVQTAKHKNAATNASIFDFIQDVLLLKDPVGLTNEQIDERRQFVFRFQQLTSPVTAKGVEDTAFYRYFPLASLTEVGGNADAFGKTVADFHAENQTRLKNWPATMLASTTHDTKRGEDTRARINVLSEMPAKWYRAILRWQFLNRTKKTMLNGYPTPDANEEYLLYQTLVGTWPLEPMDLDTHRHYVQRIQEYMIKALKEAKVHTSWLNPNAAYEDAVSAFVQAALELSPDNQFLKDFESFQQPVAKAGVLNSLGQLVIKMTVPGVPDFYQGTELWNFSLVDPDNRRPVNYEANFNVFEKLKKSAEGGKPALVAELMTNPADGRIKMYTMWRGLMLRRDQAELFEKGEYIPLDVEGPKKDHICAYARSLNGKIVIIIVSRFHSSLSAEQPFPVDKSAWEGTSVFCALPLDPHVFTNIFTGEKTRPDRHGTRWQFPVGRLIDPMMCAVLESENLK